MAFVTFSKLLAGNYKWMKYQIGKYNHGSKIKSINYTYCKTEKLYT